MPAAPPAPGARFRINTLVVDSVIQQAGQREVVRPAYTPAPVVALHVLINLLQRFFADVSEMPVVAFSPVVNLHLLSSPLSKTTDQSQSYTIM